MQYNAMVFYAMLRNSNKNTAFLSLSYTIYTTPLSFSTFIPLHPVKVSIKEIWNILCEMKLKGPLTKVQFEKCVKYVLQDEAGKEEDHMVSPLIN